MANRPPPLPTLGMHHISRETYDCDRMKDFYMNVLGFRELARPPFKFAGYWLEKGTTQVHIIERDPKSHLPESPYNNDGQLRSHPERLRQGPHVAIVVSDYDLALETLKKHKIEYHTRPLPGSTRKQIWFFDCDGYGIELLTLDEPAMRDWTASKL